MFDVDVDTDEEPLLFKAQLYELTGVQTDRQKVMSKGITLKNDGKIESGYFKMCQLLFV